MEEEGREEGKEEGTTGQENKCRQKIAATVIPPAWSITGESKAWACNQRKVKSANEKRLSCSEESSSVEIGAETELCAFVETFHAILDFQSVMLWELFYKALDNRQ